MKHFTIMGDASCDMTEQLQAQYDVTIVPSHIMLPDGRDIPSFFEWKELDRARFYQELKARPEAFSTSPPNVAEFAAAFEKVLSEGEDILLLTISSGISGTFGFASQAQKEVMAKYPDRTIRIVDTQRFSAAHGLLMQYASKKRAEGLSVDEVADYLEQIKNHIHQAGWLDDLSFVAKKGRMTHAKAFFGTLAGIKPIGEFDYNGLTTVIGKVKGQKAAYSLLLKYIARTIKDPADQDIVIAYTDRLAQAQMYAEMIEKEFHPRSISIREVFPMCGISIGPGLMAAYYYGTPISQGLTEERKIIEECLEQKA